ncbi:MULTISPECIES: hypothetical protein [unclassified Luteimonas]
MVEIKQVAAGFRVSGASFDEVFHSRFKATMAAHAVALGDATLSGRAVTITMPTGWGDTLLVEPGPALHSSRA